MEYALRRFLTAFVTAVIPLVPATAVLAQDPGTAPVASVAPMTARGNEPGWRVTFTPQRMVFEPMEGSRIDVALPHPEAASDNGTRYAADGLTVTLTPALCHDTMTGMPYPETATVETGGKVLSGCAGAPGDLLAGDTWEVTFVGETPVAEAGQVTIVFYPDAGGVSGSSGCNRYFGGFTLNGEGLSFGSGLAGSMMMCEDDRMKLERGFLEGLARVTRFDINAEGTLVLIAGDDPVIRAYR